jgi:hypothetical protein
MPHANPIVLDVTMEILAQQGLLDDPDAPGSRPP